MAEGIYTLPVLLALTDPAIRPELSPLLGQPLGQPERDKARSIVAESGAIERSVVTARGYADLAAEAARTGPSAVLAEGFADLAHSLVDRWPRSELAGGGGSKVRCRGDQQRRRRPVARSGPRGRSRMPAWSWWDAGVVVVLVLELVGVSVFAAGPVVVVELAGGAVEVLVLELAGGVVVVDLAGGVVVVLELFGGFLAAGAVVLGALAGGLAGAAFDGGNVSLLSLQALRRALPLVTASPFLCRSRM